ncbi:alpha/beta fold hydrolase [Pontibacter harenae]|uniref:alpha/beta fold hydrolase n=1 Tax=Pontibacter harenae TaxID=2894083 RepID=UPI001E3C643E|nr:alpha/beta fold hydrolase [Pontibacter harenae]MCC9166813.1 alpha/beta hydrolase [Pontibacter harenae]
MQQESIYIPVTPTDTLHLKRFYTDKGGAPVFLVHGSIENGHIFYSKSGKGFAPFLAKQGHDVFVADLRGRGKSKPSISSRSDFGLTHTLQEDFPAFISKIKELKGDVPQYWGAHSWGGVLMLAYLTSPIVAVQVRAMAFFGSKRRISIWSLKRLLMIGVVWNWFSKAVIAAIGWLPAKKLRIGSDSETRLTHKQTLEWVVRKKWLDWKDCFNYAAALQQMHLPPTLYLTGVNDDVLGHPTVVEKLMQETGSKNSAFHVVSKANGNLHNYNHISLLTHADAPKDHFLQVVQWFKQAGAFAY